MDYTKSNEDLEQILQVMRVLAPDIGEDKFQLLLDAQEYLLNSGFLDAVWGIVRLQEEENINLADVIDRFQQLINENQKLTTRQASLKEKFAQNQEIHLQVSEDIAAAKKELEAITHQIKERNDKLSILVSQTDAEKKRIDADLEKYRKKVGVTQSEVNTAGLLKSMVDKAGLSLEMTLDLVKEFAPYRDARERLSTALEKEETLTKHITSLEKRWKSKRQLSL